MAFLRRHRVTLVLLRLPGLIAGLMALGLLVGSEANAPLARAVIGGLLVSTALTLFLIPTLDTILEERFPRRLEAEDAHAP